jgi:photosystem II stability/assembly factor-like uncharacterized protein
MTSYLPCGGFLALIAACTLGITTTEAKQPQWHLTELPVPQDLQLNRILFANDRIGWVCAGLNSILKTVDGGQSWVELKTNLSVPQIDLSSLWFADESQGWAAGATDKQPTIWETNDGGVSWTVEQVWPRPSAKSIGGMLDIRFTDKEHGWAVGYNGFNAMIVATSDGGLHWRSQYMGAEITGQLSRVRFYDSLNGWALSLDAVMQTEDGGESWHLRHYDGASLNDIDVVSPTQAWVAGAWGHLMHTRDGVGWHQVPFNGLSDTFVAHVKYINKDRGWAWGTKGEILMTRDAGKTWTQEDSPLRVGPDREITTGEMAVTNSSLFMIVNPGHLLIRSIE